MTLEQIVSGIELNLINGFKGNHNNSSYRIEQIRDDFLLAVNTIYKELIDRGLLNIGDIAQSINCVELKCKDISECCDYQAGITALHFKIPELASLFGRKAVHYVGLINRYEPFKVVWDNQLIYNKYSVTGKEPYVWFSDRENGWLFNPPTKNIEVISIRALFTDPFKLNEYKCCDKLFEHSEFPATPDIILKAMENVTNKYLNHYRRVNIPYIPNNGQVIV